MASSNSKSTFPKTIGQYRLLDLIGKGGMGEIFLAEDPVFQRKVALKKILSKLVSYQSIKKRFLNEAKIAARLAHPSIIPIYSLHTHADQIYYTMPYIKGETLKEVLKETRENEKAGDPPHALGSSIPALMRIFLSVCQAMDYAHSNGFLHRDLKPENIIVGKFGEVMILDWGIAHQINNQESNFFQDLDEVNEPIPSAHFTDLTRPGKVVGTVNYMAPERAFGQPSTTQTDIYSLGILLYQLLTLRLPFFRPSLKDFKKIHQKERWTEPQELAPHRDIPLKLTLLAKKCIHPNPAFRFQSVRDIIAQLEDYIEGRPAWIPHSRLAPKNAADWEFQENIPLTKYMAILRLSGHVEWVMLMISKEPYSGNTKIATSLQLRKESSGIGFLLCVPNTKQRAGLEEGYLVWIGSEAHPGCKLFRTGVEMMAIPDQALTYETKYDIAIEKSDTHLRLLINGQLILDYISHLPLIGGHVGLLSRDASFAIDELEVLLGSQSATVNCLAIPDAFFTSKDYDQALCEYRRIAHSFQGRVEAREAFFRAGMTLFEQGKAASDLKKQDALFNEAFDEFEKLHGTPGAPLEYLGKSLICHAQNDLDEEIKCLELALRKYAKHPLLPLLEEHVSFRLHEAAAKKRQAAYSFLLLALRHLPRTLASKETQHLIDNLTSNWEPLPFIETPTAFSSLEAQNFCLAIELSFWLANPTVLYEISQKIDPELPEGLFLISNALFTLLEMDYSQLASYICDRLFHGFPPFANSQLKAIFSFIFEVADRPISDQLKLALERFPLSPALTEKPLFYYLLRRGLTVKTAPSLLPFLERIDCPPLFPLHIWAALLARDKIAAKKYLDRAAQVDYINRSSPYYLLYGCYLALIHGEEAARNHFLISVEMHYPPTSALLSHYLSNQQRLEQTWAPHAFLWEKIALYDQLALYVCCLGQISKAVAFEEKSRRERASKQVPLHFL
ncbi:MAG: protein kinase [Chlamydiota bacterium]